MRKKERWRLEERRKMVTTGEECDGGLEEERKIETRREGEDGGNYMRGGR